MRILIVTTTFPPHLNGQATFSGNLAQGLVKHGHWVGVVVPQRGWKLKVEEYGNLSVWRVPGLPLSLLRNELVWVWRLGTLMRGIFNAVQPEIVHLQDSSPLCRAALKEARRRGIPVLATHHPGPEIWAPYFSWLARYFRPIVAWAAWRWMLSYLNRVDGVVVPSTAAAQILRQQRLRSPLHIISCGVDWQGWQAQPPVDPRTVRQAWNLDPDRPLFLYVGRLDPEKRLPVLLKAVAEVQGRPFQVALAGEGGMEATLRRWVSAHHLQDRVQFLGWVPREAVIQLLQAADVFVMPGDVESLSLATLEAMACGKPVIAARAMALPELVHHGENGRLFQPGDPNDLAIQIQWFLEHPETWAVMGERGRQMAQAHDLNHTIAHYERLYHQLGAPEVSPLPVSGTQTAWGGARFSISRILAVLLVVLGALFLSDMYRAPAASASGLTLDEMRTAVVERLERLFEQRNGGAQLPDGSIFPWQHLGGPVRMALFARGHGRMCPPLILEWQPLPTWLTEGESGSPMVAQALVIVESDLDAKRLQMVWQPHGCANLSEVPDSEQSLLQSYKVLACQVSPAQEDPDALRCGFQVLEDWVQSGITP
ncbi:glycosyltransferase [uncultured Thermanaerothrix sp.]|uniref:glycosyltransferase n=1 Tax=uncultured Thermanaerothrix sp. TaxID=1195149 RepID=UPI0026254902|nr:glycosyltransferase [uncultured Thermanaerothrix sp.]